VRFLVSNGPVNLIADIAGYTTRPRLSTEDLAELDWGADSGVPRNITVGDSPQGVAFDGEFIWVANSGTTDSLTKVTPSTGATTTVALPTGANACLNPDGVAYGAGSIWVACNGSNRVVRINPTSNSVVANIVVGSAPREIAYDGSIWVTNFGSNTVSVISSSTNALTNTVNLNTGAVPCEGPVGIARGQVTGSGILTTERFWVACNQSNTVSRISQQTLAAPVVTNFNPGGGFAAPVGVAFDGRDVWVTSFDTVAPTTTLRRIDVNGTVVEEYLVNNLPAGVLYDGRQIWVTAGGLFGGTSVSRIDPLSGTVVESEALGGGGLNSLAFDGLNVWATNFTDDTVQKLPAS
jgi:YVTN family beta-propeller protein